MVDDFVIARNPDPDSSLPYLVRIPWGEHGIVLKVRDTWPRTSKVYCHRAPEWPADPEVVERVKVRSCVRRGASIDLILDRGRENRSQFIITKIRGEREAIFWQSPRTTKKARPLGVMPTGRAQGIAVFEVLVDTQERYPYTFSPQTGRGQIQTVRRRLPVGDYAVERDGVIVAAVERKSLDDLSGSLLSGKLRFAMAELSAVGRAAVVVEDRYSRIFALEHARPSAVADTLAETQVRYPSVPIIFAESRPMAQEWTYRFLAAALNVAGSEALGNAVELPDAAPLTAPAPSVAEVRAWAVLQGLKVSDRGRLRPEVWAAYRAAHAPGQ